MPSEPVNASRESATWDSKGASADWLGLAVIPAGTFAMRDARSESSRQVSLLSFQIGETPVTQAQWNTVASRVDSTIPPFSDSSPLAPAHPVTWFQAVRWCNAASTASGLSPAYEIHGREVEWRVDAPGYRLPTEAEWEFSCRAGTLGATYGALPDIAWTAQDDVSGPQNVGLKNSNAFGLFDTIGNVWEWCWDYMDTARYADYRSLRGGGWADREWSCRASVRRGSAPDAALEDVGFRVARGAVGEVNAHSAQGWSREADSRRADIRGPLPMGWTPLRRGQ